jgi:hypothetical protein
VSAKTIAADLTGLFPRILDGTGNIRDIGPSFCLPWFLGEPPITGAAAAIHRRGSALHTFGEANFDRTNPSRRSWAEGWLAMCTEPDQLKRPGVRLAWDPEKNGLLENTFTSLVARALAPEQSHANCLALVVPDAIGPGGQQDLLDDLSREDCDARLIPRPVAAALAWCNSDVAKNFLTRSDVKSGNYLGELIVTTAHQDNWEISRIRIRVQETDNGLTLCPVRDRTKAPSEIPFWGIAWDLGQGLRSGMDLEECWIRKLLGKRIPSICLPDQKSLDAAANFVLSLGIAHQSPDPNGIEKTKKRFSAQDSCFKPLGIVHSGFSDDGDLPPPFRFVTRMFPSTPLLTAENLVLKGALVAAQRALDKIPIYFETLVPLDIFVQSRNKYDDPVPGWEPLIELAEIEEGSEYRTLKPIRGFTLPARQTELPLCLRRDIQGQVSLRGATARIHNPFSTPEDAELIATVRPGHGQGNVVVQSVDPDKFSTSLGWSGLEQRNEHPTIKHAWPPGVAKIISVEELAYPAKRTMSYFLDRYRNGSMNQRNVDYFLDEVRKKINVWHPQAYFEKYFHYRPPNCDGEEVDSRFLYLGPIPSDKGVVHECLEAVLDDFSVALEEVSGSRPSASAISCGSWLYQRCPRTLREAVLSDFLSERSLDRSRLFFAGTVFSLHKEMRAFFVRFVREVSHNYKLKPLNWIRAYRNIARFRPEGVSPAVMTRADQEKLSDFVLLTIRNQVDLRRDGHILYDSLRVFPHMLKRRRFEQDFLQSESEKGKAWEKTLRYIVDHYPIAQRWKDLARASLKFLFQEADDSTIELVDANDN